MDYNSLNNNAFNFALNRLPHTAFRAVSVNIPGMSMPVPEVPQMQSVQYYPGSAIDFAAFNMTFIVDENLSNYEELYKWINQQQINNKYKPTTTEDRFLVSDGVLVTMTNASNPNRTIFFKDMFPVSLGEIQFDSRDSNVEPATCTVEFRYSYFELVPKVV